MKIQELMLWYGNKKTRKSDERGKKEKERWERKDET